MWRRVSASQAKAARADPAFGFDELMAAGRLRHGRQLAELRAPLPQPCVVLASQPEPSDLRLGDAPRLLQRWRAQADSLLLLTSPWHTPDLLARLGPLGLRTLLCPIDVRIDQAQALHTHTRTHTAHTKQGLCSAPPCSARPPQPAPRATGCHRLRAPPPRLLGLNHLPIPTPLVTQASLLLRELQPHRVLWLADEPAFAAHPQSASSSTPLAAAAPPTAPAAAPPADPRHSSAAVKQLVLCEPVTLRFKRRFVHARMPTDAARAVSLRPLPGGVRGSRVRATLRPTEDGTMVLLPGAATGDVGGASEDKELATLYGEQDTPALLAALRKRGLRPVLQEGHAGHEGHEGPTAVVRLAGVEGVRIELRQGESTVYLQHSTQAIGSLVTEALREQLL